MYVHLVSHDLLIKLTVSPCQEKTDNARFKPGQSHKPLLPTTTDLEFQLFLRELQPKRTVTKFTIQPEFQDVSTTIKSIRLVL